MRNWKSFSEALERRAAENLRASHNLINVDPPCPNASASRAYFAAYQCCVGRLASMGIPPPTEDGVQYWRHKGFSEKVADTLKLGSDAGDLELLYGKRIMADYYEDEIEVAVAGECGRIAEEFMRRVNER